MKRKYTIGLDYGTDSVRSLIVDVTSGEEIASLVFSYPRWGKGFYCDPAINQFRQHPLDYLEGLEYTILEALGKVSKNVAEKVIGISIDATGSTLAAVDEKGTPLALNTGFEENPNAMFMLWKDHTAVKEAREINDLARLWEIDFTRYEGGIYSSEWFWAKILHVLRIDAEVREAAYSWVELCDWIPAVLTGRTVPLTLKRSRCAAGHKAMWHEDFGGLPSEAFLSKLDPLLNGLRDRLYKKTFTCDVVAGTLSQEWAVRLGLAEGVTVGVGAFDAHAGALGAEIIPYYMCKILGTSSCDMLVVPTEEMGDKLVPGICGQVDGSIIPGMIGLEAGQPAFGDLYGWFKKILLWPVEQIFFQTEIVSEATINKLIQEIDDKIINELSKEAARIPIDEGGVLAIDWINGRGTPYADENLKGVIANLSLGTDSPHIFRALVEAAAFGSKAVVNRFTSEGVRIDGIIALGGVAKKSPFIMQIVADVLNMPVKVARSGQACALGAAMAASVAAGFHKTIQDAQKRMGGGFETTYYPIPENVEPYQVIYQKYLRLGAFISHPLFK